jgi:hypothetical protein
MTKMFNKRSFWIIVFFIAAAGLMIIAELSSKILLADAIKNNSVNFWAITFLTLVLCIALFKENRLWNKAHPQKLYY